jgi:hypothetical protein
MTKVLVSLICAFALSAGSVSLAQESKPGRKAQNTSAAFEALKKLVGEWTGTGRDGKPKETMFRLTAGGSVLVETLNPGKPMEMVTMYYMDGPDLKLTHYCFRGNQPQLKAESAVDTRNLSFKSVGGTNMKLTDFHMGQADFKLIDEDNFEVIWTSFTNGKPDGYLVSLQFTRKK